MRLFLSLTTLAALILPMAGLFSDSTLRGTDAYYYALQADSWQQTGEVRIPDSSPLHPLIGTLMKSGLSGEAAVKTWQALSLGLFCAAFLCFFRRRPSPGWLFLLLWLLISPSILFCALEFPKTFAFVMLFTLGLAAAKANGRWVCFTAILFVLACLVHRMAIPYTLLAIGALFVYGRADEIAKIFLSRQKPLKDVEKDFLYRIIPTIFIVALISGWKLIRAELARFDGSNLTPGLFSLFLEPNLPLAIKVELLAAAGLLLALCLKNPRGKRGVFFAVLLAAPACIPALGTEPFNLGERFALLFPLTVLLSAAFLWPPASWPAQAYSGQAWPLCAFMLLALAGGFFRLDYSYPARLNPPYPEYDKIIRLLEQREIPMLIAHWDFHFYYKYRTGREAFSYEPEKHWPLAKTWRLLYGPTPAELHAWLPPERGWRDGAVILLPGTPYTLIREDVYQTFRAAVEARYNPALYDLLWSSVMNPSRPRPAFLYEKHRNDTKDEFSALP